MKRYVIIFRKPDPDRWFRGDRYWRAKIRRIVRGPEPVGGVEAVYLNLIQGLSKLGVPFETNIPYSEIQPKDRVGIIGVGPQCLQDYNKPNRILAGVAVAEHPMVWPGLFQDKPVARYVVHCDWVKSMYERHYGKRIVTWAVGIDTDYWAPAKEEGMKTDFLIYDKIMWDPDRARRALLEPIIEELDRRGLKYSIIRYGKYERTTYKKMLHNTKAMIFLCEHETQGLAYQEAMSSGVPVLAWNPGAWLDPWRYRYGETNVMASSVPFFDERCGLTFCGATDFPLQLTRFTDLRDNLSPRAYVLENLSLEGSARNYLALLDSIAGDRQ